MDVDTDVKQLEGNQEVLTIGDAKDASTDEEEAINLTLQFCRDWRQTIRG